MTTMPNPANTVRPNGESALRPVFDRDRAALATFFSELSPESSFLRFFSGAFTVTERTLDVLLCRGRPGRAFVAVEDGRIVAHVMWVAVDPGRVDRAEIAFVVAEDRRGRGLATGLSRIAVADAARSGVREIRASVLATNPSARRVVERVLPHATVASGSGEVAFTAAVRRRRRTMREMGSGAGRYGDFLRRAVAVEVPTVLPAHDVTDRPPVLL